MPLPVSIVRIKKKWKAKAVGLLRKLDVIRTKLVSRSTIKTKKLPSGLRIELDIAKRVQYIQWKKNIYEPHIFHFAKRILCAGDTAIDLGAHVGYWTLEFAAHVGAKGNVIAVEPAPDNYRQLLRNIELNSLKNVHAFQAGISDRQGRAQLILNLKNEGGHWIGEQLATGEQSVDIDITTLDALVEKTRIGSCKLIKIDTEGHEIHVLQGMTTVLSSDALRPQHLIIEVSLQQPARRREVSEILGKYGYIHYPLRYPLSDTSLPVTEGGYDMYFRHKSVLTT
ncbi:MAG: FkbM family methyltransferase [Gammaproteobacteria bacterium]|nr:MAG: FkbM family methyltransferase [Gammaproteobacteria bacterium]